MNIGFFGNLNEYLIERVNALISDKQKLSLMNPREYFAHRALMEQNVIQNVVHWQNYFETCGYLTYPTVQDRDVIADCNNVSDSDLMTFTVILNHALKGYIDSYAENTANCFMLHEFYKLLKEETAKRPSLSFYPSGDGFTDYLESRIERHEQERKLEDARHSGLICIYCGSTNVKSYDSQKWHCKDCKRFFRKH